MSTFEPLPLPSLFHGCCLSKPRSLQLPQVRRSTTEPSNHGRQKEDSRRFKPNGPVQLPSPARGGGLKQLKSISRSCPVTGSPFLPTLRIASRNQRAPCNLFHPCPAVIGGLPGGLSSKVEPASARDSPTRAAKIQYDLLRLTIAAN